MSLPEFEPEVITPIEDHVKQEGRTRSKRPDTHQHSLQARHPQNYVHIYVPVVPGHAHNTSDNTCSF